MNPSAPRSFAPLDSRGRLSPHVQDRTYCADRTQQLRNRRRHTFMNTTEADKKLGDLSKPAAASLDELLQLEELKGEQWLMRFSVGGHSRGWQPLTLDSATNDRIIKERIEESDKPITDLVLAFVGMVEWRGRSE